MKKARKSRRRSGRPIGSKAVVVYLEAVTPEVVKVCFQDCERAGRTWVTKAPFTHFEVSAQRLRKMKLTRSRLYEIGLALTARLTALEKLLS
jgi:hypothetical protein